MPKKPFFSGHAHAISIDSIAKLKLNRKRVEKNHIKIDVQIDVDVCRPQ